MDSSRKILKSVSVFILLTRCLVPVNCKISMNSHANQDLSCPLEEEVHFHINRSLYKQGFHRDLAITATAYMNTTTTWMLLIKLALKTDAYIDPYRLHSDGYQVFIKGEVEFEKPAHLAKPITIYIYKNISSDKNSRISFEFFLPIHLRYQKPEFNKKYSSITFDKPQLFVNCLGKRKDLDTLKEDPCNALNTTKCFWKELSFTYMDDFPPIDIPIGSKEDTLFVIVVTVLITVSGTVYLMYITLKKPKLKSS